jgi:serine/threonine-protein kinase
LGIPLHPPKRKPINTPQPTEAPKQPIFTDPLLGQTFGNFKIEEKIGVGGFGAIYRATQVFLQQPIAVKVLHVELQDNTEVVERFRREARALAQLRHENIVQLSDFGLLPGLGFYIAMEFLNGQSLHERIKQGEAFTIQEIMRICESLCDVLAYVHQKGIIHRDLKPSNIIMHTDDIRGTSLKLIDFGIAAIQSNPSQQALTRIGSNLGTLRYMSPEQIIGSRHLDGRSDMYSVATILYRLLTGYIPFTANNDPTLMHQKTHDPPRPINVSKPDMHWPAAVIHFFNRALALDANQRPPTASAFWQEAKQALSTLMPQGNPAPSYTQPPPQNTPLSNGFPGPLPPMAPHPQTSLTPQHQTEQIDDLFGEAYELKPKKASTMVWFLFGLLVVLGLAGGLMVWKVFF